MRPLNPMLSALYSPEKGPQNSHFFPFPAMGKGKLVQEFIPSPVKCPLISNVLDSGILESRLKTLSFSGTPTLSIWATILLLISPEKASIKVTLLRFSQAEKRSDLEGPFIMVKESISPNPAGIIAPPYVIFVRNKP